MRCGRLRKKEERDKLAKKQLTIDEIARLSDVSVATVSRVLNGNPQVGADLVDRVKKVIEETGYSPSKVAAGFARGHQESIALISGVPDFQDIPDSGGLSSRESVGASQAVNSYVLSLSFGIYDVLEPGGYRLRLVNIPREINTLSAPEVKRWIQMTIDSREIAGAIFMNPADHEPVLEALLATEHPCVVLGDSTSGKDAPRVDVDNVDGMRAVTGHLLELGHRRIGFLCPKGDRTVIRDRSEGFVEAHEYLGIPLMKNWWLESPMTEPPIFSYRNARLAVERAIDSDFPCTAIVAYNDEMAFGAIQAFSARGWNVPARVSVVGFDDLPAAPMFAPPLTTVRQDIVKIGQHAARNLLRSLKGRAVPHVTIIPTQLVVRDSSAPPRAG